MVRNDVHDDLEILFMSLLHICLEEVVITEAAVDMVVVCTCVAVVCCLFEIVLDQRSTPDRSRTELADIVEVVDYTLDVTAMASERLAAVCLVGHALYRVVGRVAVCEAVRHDEVDHVRCSEACTLCGTLSA